MTSVTKSDSLSNGEPEVLDDALIVFTDTDDVANSDSGDDADGSPTRRELRRMRRRRRWGDRGLELLVALIGLGAITAGFLGYGLNDLTFGKKKVEPLNRTPPAESSAVALKPLLTLVVIEDGQGEPGALSIIVPESDRSGGDIVFVPLGIMAEVASFGLRPIREVPGLGNKNLLAETVTNMLGVNFDAVDVVTPAQLSELVAPIGALSVDLPTSVEVPRKSSAPNGSERSGLRVGPGLTKINPDELFSLFAAASSESELDRIVRHQAIWEAWLAKAAKSAPAGVDAARFPAAIAALASGETAFHILPVESISGGTKGSDELFRIRAKEAGELLTKLGGGSATDRITVQLLNGTGRPGISQHVLPLLAPAGVEVTLTGNASRFDHQTTMVVYSDPKDRPAAEALQKTLGLGEVVRSRVNAMLVDVMVVIGQDLAARFPTEPTVPTPAPARKRR
ncbi:MAG: LCP family protein [Acidimicrobiales bacterium]